MTLKQLNDDKTRGGVSFYIILTNEVIDFVTRVDKSTVVT